MPKLATNQQVTTLKIGDRVRYTVEFCQSIGAYAGDIPHDRGVIISLDKLGARTLATISWQLGSPKRVIVGCIETY